MKREHDPLAMATDGQYHWDDPGMDDYQRGWEGFGRGQRVEVQTAMGWIAGTVRETPDDNSRGIVVECDEVIDPHGDMYHGHGVMIMVAGTYRRVLWSVLRTPGRSQRTGGDVARRKSPPEKHPARRTLDSAAPRTG